MHTLEALISLVLITGVVIFSVQATSLTPLTSSTANAHIESQLQTMGQDILTSLDYSPYGQKSELKKDILSWDGTCYNWNSERYISSTHKELTNSSIAEILNFVAVPRGMAHNVEMEWMNNDGTIITMPYIYNGNPSDNAVTISKRVLLSDQDIESAAFAYNTGIWDADPSTDFYNLVNVRLTLWRM
ncbi:MAG: hypothetical protein H5T43_06740 [Methanomethylovorans sp.]|nr:hypothetical protein [Methanomethylovorans sp.]